MKILDIRFKNLNSLKGEWHINLSAGPYISDGIFAITGPTGSGKTTIFDAVCLALYGKTPRLDKISSSTNEIMTKGTGECYAQVTFTANGRTYTARWRQSRAYNNWKGKLQTPVHKLDGDLPITSKNSDTPEAVEKIIGMNFQQFTQAMMLRQGGFDAFLMADKNNRAKILEAITGIDIYGEISKKVFQRAKDKKREADDTQIKRDEIISLLADSESLNKQLQENNAQKAKLEAEHENIKAERDILREIDKLENDLRENQLCIDNQLKRLDEFAAERIKLDSAERAASLEAEYTRLESERKALNQVKDSRDKISREISEHEQKISNLQNERIPELNEQLQAELHDLTEHPDAVKARIIAVVDKYDKAQETERKLVDEHKRKESEFSRAQVQARKLLNERNAARQKMDTESDEYRKITEEIMSLRTRTNAAVLDEERTKLKDGVPCPLCGSLEHPAAAKHLTNEKALELFRQTETLEAKSKQSGKRVKEASEEFDIIDKKYNLASSNESALKRELDRIQEDLHESKQEISVIHSSVSEAINLLGLAGKGITSTQYIRKYVSEWADKVKHLSEQIRKAEQSVIEFNASLVSLRESFALESDNLAKLTESLRVLQEDFTSALIEHKFTNESDFTDALVHVKSGNLPIWQEKRKKLDDCMTRFQALDINIKTKLDKIKASCTITRTLEEVELLFKKQESEIKSLNNKSAIIEDKLTRNAELESRIKDLNHEYESRKKIADNWAGLNKLIGSANGDAFRVFAQKITLSFVLNNANKYLSIMSGRYSLVITPGSDDLALSVIDNEQGGEVRPTENLSGGERFIVSLALALGLSQISANKTRVDSLFLDEGFGSLDDEALSTALDALGEVKSKGRMIGIISHVQALKERISAQINVIPKREGTSIIEGPGCESL